MNRLAALKLELLFPADMRLTRAQYAEWGAELFSRASGRAALWGRANHGYYEVMSIAVSPLERGRGHARALLRRAEQRARELRLRGLKLQVVDSNHAAQWLYLTEGYEYETLINDTWWMRKRFA